MSKWVNLSLLAGLFLSSLTTYGQATATPFTSDQYLRVIKTSWAPADEKKYSEFIQKMGSSKCNTVDTCIRSELANMYAGTDSFIQKFSADCAYFPYILRMYFSWKNGLPFAYNAGVKPIIPADAKPEDMPEKWDNRYSRWGNTFSSRKSAWPSSALEQKTFASEMARLRNSVSTASFRHHPELSKPFLPDFYSANLDKVAIRPGTNIYDPNGHVVIVYEVTKEGRVKYFESHPDNTVSRGSYSRKFVRASLNAGAGFKNFRPVVMTGAKQNRDGQFFGGVATYLENAQIPEFSLLQQLGTNPDLMAWSKGKFVLNGRELDYYKFVQWSLAEENFRLNPVTEFEDSMNELCVDVQERARAVDLAVKGNIHLKSHPEFLPHNVYGAEGEWEEFATSGRDVRLRAGFYDLMLKVREYFDLIAKKDPVIGYTGPHLKNDLLKAFQKVNYSCQLGYTNSDGQKIQLSLEHVMARLYKISFDPYHCPERRWGAEYAYELRTCLDDSDKSRWYDAMDGLRRFLTRDSSQVMGFSVEDLENKVPGSLPSDAKQINLNVKTFLESLPN